MKKIYFRILAICLSLVLTFSILYKDSIQAEALEWVGVAVGYDTAFKFLLGLLGVSVGVGVAENVDWGTLRENAIQVQLDQGNSQAEVSAWWNDVINGSLDTASGCWSAFKDWLIGATSTPSLSGVQMLDLCNSAFNISPSFDMSNVNTANITGVLVMNYNSPSNFYDWFIFYEPVYLSGNSLLKFSKNETTNVAVSCSYVAGNTPTASNLRFNTPRDMTQFSNMAGYSHCVYLGAVYNNIDQTYHNIFTEYNGVLPDVSSDLEALYPNIGDIALNPENADTLSTDVIPLPWENIGTSDTAIEDVIDDAISKVNDGTMSLENYWEYVQNITNTYAYSIENNYLLPNENGEDKKADDKVKENSENGAFVLYGLEKVFPFCIPFDIYAFITLLKADPVAPVIEYPIYNPVTQENEIITIDFSEWESVVIIFRYIFDFLLIIGLLLLARPLVGAGGDS